MDDFICKIKKIWYSINMEITKNKIEEIASLARVSLKDTEKEKYIKQIASILDYFEQLKEVDTKDIDPLINPNPLISVMREDYAFNSNNGLKEDILAQTPERKIKYIKVKKVL